MNQPVLLGLAAFAATCLVPLQEALGFESPKPLSGDQVQNVLLGNTLIGAVGALSIYYPSTETIWGRSDSGDVDVGRWWIENDSYCRSWRRWFDAEVRCWQLVLGADDSVFWYSLDGNLAGRSLIRSGNALGELATQGAPSSQLAQGAETPSSGLDRRTVQVTAARKDEFAFDRMARSEHSDNEPPKGPANQAIGPDPAARSDAPRPSTANLAIATGSAFTLNFAAEDSMAAREPAPPAEPAPAPAPTPTAAPEATSSVSDISYGKEAMSSVVESAKNGKDSGSESNDGRGRD
ncbi:MAG TPA: hypothetical protein VED46_10695 [Alphaproteobacteria bacterium]|nr:hypothetical protein [Alphaproteobacteria bacterium]